MEGLEGREAPFHHTRMQTNTYMLHRRAYPVVGELCAATWRELGELSTLEMGREPRPRGCYLATCVLGSAQLIQPPGSAPRDSQGRRVAQASHPPPPAGPVQTGNQKVEVEGMGGQGCWSFLRRLTPSLPVPLH